MDRPSKKSRNTRQRATILDVLKRTRSHPSAEAIYREARKELPNISLGTVYRNLNFLQEEGAVKEIRPVGGTGSRFEAVLPPHGHFHCSRCSAIHDIPLPETLRQIGWEETGIISSVHGFELSVVGACTRCVAQGAAAPSA